MNHPTQQELFDHADGLDPAARSAQIAAHLDECPRCRSACDAAVALTAALRGLEPDRPSPRFTATLLNRLGLRESASLWWLFFRHFAPVLAAAVMAGAVLMLGSMDQGTEGGSAGKSLFDPSQIAGAVRGASDAVSSWKDAVVGRYISFSIGKDAVTQVIFLAFLFAAIGLLDRYVLGPILRRRHQG